MRRTSMVMVVLAAVLLAAGLVYAQTPPANMPYGKGQKSSEGQKGAEGQKGGQGHKNELLQALNLTPEQQQKLEANRQAQHENMNKLFTSLKEGQNKLRQALKDPAVTNASVAPLVNEIKSLQGQIVDSRVNAIFAVKAILTPEQFAKFQQMTDNWQGKRQENKKERKDNWGEKRKDANTKGASPAVNPGQQ
jgi:Spy/CpxP family protein refolding chaperone